MEPPPPAEYDRLITQGVTSTRPPTDVGPAVVAFDDTCDLIQIVADEPVTA